MLCPNCGKEMKEVRQNNVPVNFCPSCKGLWLDAGKINYFVQNPPVISQQLSQGLINESQSSRLCPACQKPMRTGGLLNPSLEINRCPSCQGIFLDTGELAELNKLSAKASMPRAERLRWAGMSMAALANDASLGGKLPSLALRSAAVLMFLYGIVFAFFFVLVEMLGAPLPLAFLFVLLFAVLQFWISPYIMDFMLKAFQSAHFISDKSELPAALAAFIESQSKTNKIPFPKMGIIEDGNPNAFTYGHTPQDARIVITRGLMDMLKEDELEAVVAHEIGHAVHWDMLIMTAAMLVPTMLYTIYRIGFRLASSSKAKKATKKAGDQIIIFAIVAFVLYIISEYIVLFLSRTREYYADRFSGVATNNPNALARGLVKVAYGLAGSEEKAAAKEQQEGKKVGLGKLFRTQQSAVRALGIFNPGSARALAAVAVSGATRRFSAENMMGAMQWDLWNPWAGWYEFNSTHPLPAKRIRALGDQASAMGQEPLVRFDMQKPESYWGAFLIDLLVYLMPLIMPIVFCVPFLAMDIVNNSFAANSYGGLLLLGLGIGMLIRIIFRYRSSEFPGQKVSDLIKTVKVSGIRPVPATIKGRIIGRGIPGLVWSEDMVLQDQSGFMFLDYKQPLRIIEFLFGLFRAKGLIGKTVTVKGWYRRSPMPYFEMREIIVDGKTRTCYVYHIKLFISLLMIAIGAAMLLGAAGII